MYLGVGKLVTSITMTVFYIFMYYIYLENYKVKENKSVTYSVWGLSIIRVILCLFPQNNWITDSSPLFWDILRNIPFTILGCLIVVLYFKERNNDKVFKYIYLLVTLSFLFYIPVVVGAGAIPMLGMLMLPKTVCYVIIMFVFNKKLKEYKKNLNDYTSIYQIFSFLKDILFSQKTNTQNINIYLLLLSRLCMEQFVM